MTSSYKLHLRVAVALLLTLGLLPANVASADYREKAIEQTEYIQSHFYDAAAMKYRDTFPIELKGLPWTTTWPNGVEWRVLVDATVDNPARYDPLLRDYSKGLMEYWNPDPGIAPPGFEAYCSGPGDHDMYYDDNAWMVLGFIEAYAATRDPGYLKWARETQAFVMSGWDNKLGGGIYWNLEHRSKNTCVNAPAAVGALKLYALGDTEQLNDATEIVSWENSTLRDNKGLYWDNIALNGAVSKTEFTYNTALMIQADILLYRLRGDKSALTDAERSADAGIAKWQDPVTGGFDNKAQFTHLLCESLLQLYGTDHNIAYLNAVRRHAAFGYRYVRDAVNGGYWSDWKVEDHEPDEPKVLLENASDARLFWLLAPYPDPEQLYSKGLAALKSENLPKAENLLQQAADSDTEAVEARFLLWRVLLREHKAQQADIQEKRLIDLSTNNLLMLRLAAAGWSPPTRG